MWTTIADEAAAESPLWQAALLPTHERQLVAVFSPLGEERFGLGIETIYEGYLLHYGRPRLFAPDNSQTALLLGDYLYAHGLVRVARQRHVGAVADLAELISLCAQLRADGRDGDGWAWAATVAQLGHGTLGPAQAALRARGDAGSLAELAREATREELLERALGEHRARSGSVRVGVR
jgi:hypothetical protein